MATRNKLRHDGKKRYEGTNPRRKPFKVSKVEDAVPNLDARQRAIVQQTKSNYPEPNNQTEVGRLGNVLRSLFKTREFYKNNIVSIELKDVANSSGTKFSFITLHAIGGKKAKMTFIYGSILEIYLTLRAWLAQR